MKINISIFIFLIILLFTLAIISLRLFTLNSKEKSPLPKPRLIKGAYKELVQYPQDYTLLLVGDSMTEALGNSDEIRRFLSQYYPEKTFEVLNYGFGSTNILSALDRLQKTTFYGRDFRPIMDINFDLILIESFGYNPLSQFPLEEGLKRQTEALDEIVAAVLNIQQKNKLVFVATISPNKKHYAESTVELTTRERTQWAEERIAYIKNHIEYAKSNGIPVINVFEKSLDKNNDGNINYINSNDLIHPSPKGIVFISREIADFIYQNHLLK